jgi:hypothetical protein
MRDFYTADDTWPARYQSVYIETMPDSYHKISFCISTSIKAKSCG